MGRESRRGTLIGRRHEQQLLAGVVDRARGGHSGVLVIRGEAGIGKTALLRDVASKVADLRVIALSGAESEMELPYAGVQQLCTPFQDASTGYPNPKKWHCGSHWGCAKVLCLIDSWWAWLC